MNLLMNLIEDFDTVSGKMIYIKLRAIFVTSILLIINKCVSSTPLGLGSPIDCIAGAPVNITQILNDNSPLTNCLQDYKFCNCPQGTVVCENELPKSCRDIFVFGRGTKNIRLRRKKKLSLVSLTNATTPLSSNCEVAIDLATKISVPANGTTPTSASSFSVDSQADLTLNGLTLAPTSLSTQTKLNVTIETATSNLSTGEPTYLESFQTLQDKLI